MKLVNFYRKPISIVVMLTFTILLCFWANQSAAAPATAAAEKSSGASMEKGGSDGTGFIETEESEPVVKKGKKFPWLIVGAVVIVGAAAVYFLVLNKKYTLTINLGEGCTGTPAATAKYKKNKAVAYNFSTQSGWGNLQVKLDGATMPANGTVTMDKDHTLDITATHGAVVNVASTPAGARIFDNGADTGKVTPASFSYADAGSHAYLLRQCGYKDYSQALSVVVGQTYTVNAALVAGIQDDFIVASPCWAPRIPGGWIVSGGFYKVKSTVTAWDFSYYNIVFGSSTYTLEAKMMKTKGTLLNSISILLATSTNMNAVNGYLIQYAPYGDYSIWKETNSDWVADTGTAVAIKNWTENSFINGNMNAWNIVKIVRSGSNYSYYINGHHIYSFSDSTYDPRVVVLTFNTGDKPTEMQYDYVKLSVGAAMGLMPPDVEPASVPGAGRKHSGSN